MTTLAEIHGFDAERSLETLLKWNGIKGWEREVRYAKPLMRRADFLWGPPHNLIVEVEGGVYIEGRHTQGKGFEDDCAKYNDALLMGYRVLRVTPRQIRDGRAVGWIRRAL